MAYIWGCGLSWSGSVFGGLQRIGNTDSRASRVSKPSYHHRHKESSSAHYTVLPLCKHSFNSLFGITWGMESWLNAYLAFFIFPRNHAS